jgi:hypothetical protein
VSARVKNRGMSTRSYRRGRVDLAFDYEDELAGDVDLAVDGEVEVADDQDLAG